MVRVPVREKGEALGCREVEKAWASVQCVAVQRHGLGRLHHNDERV